MPISRSVERFLGDHNVRYTVVHHAPAYTAQEEAAVTHTPGRMWAKAVACFADGDPVLAVLPADAQVDMDRLQAIAGVRGLRLANEAEFESLYPDCEIGAMPPLGPLYKQRVFVDRSLTEDEEIVFNGGSHTDAIRMSYADFDRLVRPVVGEFARRPGARAGL